MNTRNKSSKSMIRIAFTALLAILAATQVNAQSSQARRPFGDVQVLGTVPASTGFPEGIAVRGNKIYVSGPARFGTAGDGTPSRVFAFDIDSGVLLRTYDIQGEDLNQDHANSCIAFDDDGRLYIVNFQLGIVRLDLASGQQEVYAAPLPNLQPCSSVAPGTPCSPTFFDAPPLGNDIAFDEDGNLFETDSFQATIWKIPAGGGQPQIWFQDSRLDVPFGANGLRLSPDRTQIYFSVTADAVGQFGNFLGGKIYTLPLVANPTAAQLQVFHEYNGEAPDGIAFGKSGRLYVALAAPFNSGVSILNPDGTESARLHNDQDPIFPYDSPANIAFDKRGSIVVTNHAFATMIPDHFVALDVFVDDKESPLVKP
jgi:sugar lactone lactonase YvrE